MAQPARLAVVGLGYVGLQLATAFARSHPTTGFDTDPARVAELQEGRDRNGDVTARDLAAASLEFTSDPERLRDCAVAIVPVPTPVDRARQPDLRHLVEASRLVGRFILRDPRVDRPVVVYESTVYPGCTEEVCIPVLERESGRKAGVDFGVGYSPERINPGDPEHTLRTVVKVVSALEPETLEIVARLYAEVVEAGVHRAPNIRTAEAAKVIENVQRDLNIALMNELATLFHRLGLRTDDVLKAARTKWNFLPFEPGLVGGHCIPVDPYYLTHKAQEVGHYPEVILAGRRINDSMGRYVALETLRLLARSGRTAGAELLVLGVTFKEDVRDVRNSRVFDLIQVLHDHGVRVTVHDPLVRVTDAALRSVDDPFTAEAAYDALVLTVPHRAFRQRSPEDYLRRLRRPGVLVDVRGVLPRDVVESAGVLYWTL